MCCPRSDAQRTRTLDRNPEHMKRDGSCSGSGRLRPEHADGGVNAVSDEDVARLWLSRNSDVEVIGVAVPGEQGTTTTSVSVATSAGPLRLKLFTASGLVEALPDIAHREAAAMVAASRVLGHRVPEVVSVADADRAAGLPTGVLMTELTGRPSFAQIDIHQAVDVMAELHDVATSDGLPGMYRAWADLDVIPSPTWLSDQDAWRAVVGLIERGPVDYQPCLIHRDFQPANILWHGGQLSGVIDWTFGCLGPAAADIAHLSMNVALLQDESTPEQVLARYRSQRPDHQHDGWWDAVEALAVVQNPDGVAAGLRLSGVSISVNDVRSACAARITYIAVHLT